MERILPSYEYFEQLKQIAGATNYRVSKDSGVSETILSNWKRGTNSPNYASLRRIAVLFDKSVDDFYPPFSEWGDK